MLGRDFAGWSDHLLTLIHNDTPYRTCCGPYLEAVEKPSVAEPDLVRAYKVSLANLILSFKPLVSPSTFLLDGRDVRELEVTFLRQQIGTVAQEPILFSTSVAENIRYGRPGASLDDVLAAARTANGYTLEFKLPWANFPNITPKAGVSIGIDIEMGSADGANRCSGPGGTFRPSASRNGTPTSIRPSASPGSGFVETTAEQLKYAAFSPSRFSASLPTIRFRRPSIRSRSRG